MSDKRPSPNLAQADAFARVLAEKGVDANEVAKSFTHLRTFLNEARAAHHPETPARAVALKQATDTWWRWLEILTGSGARTVVRSGLTQRYYEFIRDAALMHLQGLEPDTLDQTMGWGVRLMRYYKETPEATKRPAPFAAGATAASPTETTGRPHVPPKPPTGPTLPAVGEVFSGRVENADETAALIGVPGFDSEKVYGLLRAEQMGGRTYRLRDTVRVEVVEVKELKSGRVRLELKPGPKAAKPPSKK